jgi:hypothetical protein
MRAVSALLPTRFLGKGRVQPRSKLMSKREPVACCQELQRPQKVRLSFDTNQRTLSAWGSGKSFPDTFEVDKVAFHGNPGNCGAQMFGSLVQFLPVMLGFGGSVVFEGLQPAVGAAVGVNHQNHALGAV